MYKFLPILLFAYSLAITTEDIYDNSYALIIGIDKYENVRSLDYAVKDAEDIQSMLMDKFNFQQDNIVLLKNEEATKTSILQEFSNITKKAESNDRVLIFFAGHGETEDLPDGGEMGYLLPVDGNKTDLYISSIKMDEIQTISLRSEAKHILYLIDACYGGIASVGARSLDANSTPDYLQKITQYKSRQIISAGGRGEQVIEKSEWGHSAFTKNLLSGLRDSKADTDSDGIITAQELGTYLKKKVTIDSDNRQTPKTRNLSTDEGEFVFVYSENTAVIQDKSADEKLDYLISEMEELKKQNKPIAVEDQITNDGNKLTPIQKNFHRAKYLSAIYPGLGHYYIGNRPQGVLWLIIESASLYGMYSSYNDYINTKRDYRDIKNKYYEATSFEDIIFYRAQYEIGYDNLIIERNQLLGMASLSAGIWIANIWNLKRIIKKDISGIPVNINMNAQGIVKITYRF